MSGVFLETSEGNVVTFESLIEDLQATFSAEKDYHQSVQAVRVAQQNLLQRIKTLAHQSTQNKDRFRECGGIPVVVGVFERVRMSAAQIDAEIDRQSEVKPDARENNTDSQPQPSRGKIGSAESDVLYLAICILRSLSVVSLNQVAIASAGAIEHMYTFLKQKYPIRMQQNAASVLWNLAADAENKLVIAKSGGIAVLFRCLRETMQNLHQLRAVGGRGSHLEISRHYRLINDITGALRNLSYRYENLQYFVEFNGAIKCLTELLWRDEQINGGESAHKQPRSGMAQAEVICAIAATQTSINDARKNAAVTLNICMQYPDAQLQIEKTNCIAQLVRVLQEFSIVLTVQTQAKYASLQAALAAAVNLENNDRVDAANNSMARGKFANALENETMIIPLQNGFLGRLSPQKKGSPHNAEPAPAAASENPMAIGGNMQWSGLDLERRIGKGAFSNVYCARYHGFPVAVKLLNDSLPENEHDRNRMLQEVRMFAALRHPNIVLLMGHTSSPEGRAAFVFEYCGRGALREVLPNERSMLRRLKFGKDIAAGLNWLHAHNIVHRDLKCANILINEDYTAKVSDLGLALLYYDGIFCSQFRGNIKYSAPEILMARAESGLDAAEKNQGSGRKHNKRDASVVRRVRYPYGPQTDVYSFALILWELVTRQPLFDDINGKQEITAFVCAGNRPPLVPGWPATLQKMLTLCWHDNPSQRPSFTVIQREFGTMMIDIMCPDPLARKICRDLWSGNETRRVPYVEFERIFQKRTQIDLSSASLCYRRCLQTMLCESSEFLVAFESVCNMVHTFGVMDSVGDFLASIVNLFEQPWFFGFLRVADAKQMLTEQWRLDPTFGYYLMRFSDNLPGAFALMTIEPDGNIVHRRIRHQYSSEFFVAIDGRDQVFPDIFRLHAVFASTPGLLLGKKPLPGAPFQCFFAANPLLSLAE